MECAVRGARVSPHRCHEYLDINYHTGRSIDISSAISHAYRCVRYSRMVDFACRMSMQSSIDQLRYRRYHYHYGPVENV